MKLEYLAPYLPYKLQVGKHFQNEFYTEEMDLSIMQSLFNDKRKKPILKPLTDLTAPIKVNGKTFIPFKVVLSISAIEEEQFDIGGIIPDYWKVNLEMFKSGDYKFIDYWIVQKLIEWHFDIFGLIEKGLAIDINTIK